MSGDHLFSNRKQEVIIGDSRVVADRNQELRAGVNGHKDKLIKGKGPHETEWVKFVAKRKSVGKGKAKGQENRPPTSQHVLQSSFVAQDMEPTNLSFIKKLPVMQAQRNEAASLSSGDDVPGSEVDLARPDSETDMPMHRISFLQASRTLGSLDAGIHSQEHGLSPMHNLDELVGIGAKNFPALVRDLKTHYQLGFLAILETMCTQEASVGKVQQLGFPNMELIQCEGYSGGIWCFWEHSILSVSVLERHHQFVHLLVTGSTGHSWMLTVVYVSPSCIGRQILWENLSHIA
ncbi:hypothetical protein K1719_031058 [Acacia pycnantha]|nr:hypothetical protein K1719_031058 [Acacia pycnantha]